MKLLITGGAGFIGVNVLHRFCNNYANYQIYCLDNLSYASQLSKVLEYNSFKNFTILKADLNNKNQLFKLFKKFEFTHIIHLAAESHVDNSIADPLLFAKTNVMGTLNILEAARKYWRDDEDHLFYHISTDEVFGALGETGNFSETTAYDPRSPYSASKASSDHFVKAYYHTYGLPVVISNCSNNYGPFQHDEKLIPTVIRSVVKGEPIPIYGDGSNVRDWLYVKDHAEAIDLIFHEGLPGQTYCIGGDAERSNLSMVKELIQLTDKALGNPTGYSDKLISFVTDRKGHDFRYAIDHSYLTGRLGWKPTTNLIEGLVDTVDYYVARYTGEL